MLVDTPEVETGKPAPHFLLADPAGREYRLADLKGTNGLVVAFICNHCPYVRAIVDRLVADAEQLQREGINVVAINSNDYQRVPADSPRMMELFASRHRFSFPYLVDEDQSVARAYGAVGTPDFFGLNASGELQYRGRLDSAGMGPAAGRHSELVDAMRTIAATGTGPTVQHPSIGCSIKWR